MKVTYDAAVDVLRILLRDVPIDESDEEQAGIIIDYDASGNIVGFEILDASRQVGNPRGVDYSIIGLQPMALA